MVQRFVVDFASSAKPWLTPNVLLAPENDKGDVIHQSGFKEAVQPNGASSFRFRVSKEQRDRRRS